MNQQALQRLGDFCKQHQLSAALLSNPATLTWLTGYAPPIQTGLSPFEGSPTLGWYLDERLILVLSDIEAGAARAQGAEVIDYVAYTIDGPIEGFANQAAALMGILTEAEGLKGKVGIELNYLPASFLNRIKESLPNVTFSRLDGQFDLLRAVKSPEEIDRIRAALRLCDLAQVDTQRLISPGASEIEVFGQMKAHLEAAAGGRLPMLVDFIAGQRTADIGGMPGGYVLREGDPVIADIVPRLDGYWGDNSGTHFVGEPTPELQHIYQVVLATLRKGIEAVKPGVRSCDLDELLRNEIRAQGYEVYPHHSGHGLGVAYHEEPRIVPYNTQSLEPGMVLAIEPGIYVPGVGGVRLEEALLVTSDGCEVLTRHLGN